MQPSLIWRIALVASALVAAVLIVREGAARGASRSATLLAIAEQLKPGDAQVNVLLARKGLAAASGGDDISADLSNPALPEAGKLAARALAYDLTRADAMAIYGLATQAGRGEQAAARIMQASASISRRDLVTRLWLIRDAARRQQLGEMLPNVDIALRTSVGARNILFPLLAQALVEDSLVPEFVRMLRPNSDWVEPFLYTAITSNRGTANLARIYLALGKKYRYGGEDLDALIMSTLVAQSDWPAAFAFNQGLTGQPQAGKTIEDPAFMRHQGFEPFTWSLAQTAEFDATRATDPAGRSALAVTSTGSQKQIVAAQLLALPAGRYRFANQVSSDRAEIRLTPEWRLRCATDQRSLGTLAPRSNPAADWSVPQDCTYQWLELSIDATATMTSETLYIGQVNLKPATGPAPAAPAKPAQPAFTGPGEKLAR